MSNSNYSQFLKGNTKFVKERMCLKLFFFVTSAFKHLLKFSLIVFV
jgi:hypothetical protein